MATGQQAQIATRHASRRAPDERDRRRTSPPAPHLGFDNPRRLLRIYRANILNLLWIKTAGRLKGHIEAQPIGGRTDQYATHKNTIHASPLCFASSKLAPNIPAVCAGEYRVPGVVLGAFFDRPRNSAESLCRVSSFRENGGS